MSPMQNRPRSLSGLKSQTAAGSFMQSPISSFGEDLPTTPLPATSSQLDLKDTAILPARRSTQSLSLLQSLNGAAITRQLSHPGVTRQLSSAGLGDSNDGAGARGPVLIKAERKRKTADPLSPQAHSRRRLLVSAGGVGILLLITVIVLFSATPLGHSVGFNLAAQPTGGTLSFGKGNTLSLVSQATATAISHQQSDGYDPYSNGTISISDGSGSLNWPVGQCTYWANYRYHELTGYWVSWTGNAAQWVAGARAAGWNVSQQPHVPSILVLMPYVQGAWGYGHVAVVESVNDTVTPEVVHTSNMNWWVGDGGWDKVSYADFTVGSGVYFVWHK
jgi:surface antigen